MADALHDYVEEFALVFEATGTPRIAGRILGWLMVCNPPEQTAGELAQALQASKASISTMTRVLTQGMLIERVPKRGSRTDYFRIRPGAWTELTVKRLMALSAYRTLAEKGLHLIESAPPQQKNRLEEMRDLFGFFEFELSGMLQRLEKRQVKTKSMIRR